MLHRTAFFALCMGFASPAWATGGFSCSVDDGNLQLEVASPLGRGMGAPIINLTADGLVKLKGTPVDLSKLELSKNLVHSWMLHPDVKLHFYTERANDKPHGYVELVIAAKDTGDEEGTADGQYELTVFYTEPPADKAEGATLKASGKVSCFVE